MENKGRTSLSKRNTTDSEGQKKSEEREIESPDSQVTQHQYDKRLKEPQDRNDSHTEISSEVLSDELNQENSSECQKYNKCKEVHEVFDNLCENNEPDDEKYVESENNFDYNTIKGSNECHNFDITTKNYNTNEADRMVASSDALIKTESFEKNTSEIQTKFKITLNKNNEIISVEPILNEFDCKNDLSYAKNEESIEIELPRKSSHSENNENKCVIIKIVHPAPCVAIDLKKNEFHLGRLFLIFSGIFILIHKDFKVIIFPGKDSYPEIYKGHFPEFQQRLNSLICNNKEKVNKLQLKPSTLVSKYLPFISLNLNYSKDAFFIKIETLKFIESKNYIFSQVDLGDLVITIKKIISAKFKPKRILKTNFRRNFFRFLTPFIVEIFKISIVECIDDNDDNKKENNEFYESFRKIKMHIGDLDGLNGIMTKELVSQMAYNRTFIQNIRKYRELIIKLIEDILNKLEDRKKLIRMVEKIECIEFFETLKNTEFVSIITDLIFK